MGKRRVHEIAKDLGIESKDLIKKLHDVGVDVKSHSSTVDEDDLKRALAGPAPKKPELARKPGMVVRKKADIPVVAQEEQPAEDEGETSQHMHDTDVEDSVTHRHETAGERGEEVLQAREAHHETVAPPPVHSHEPEPVSTQAETHAPTTPHEAPRPVAKDEHHVAAQTQPSAPVAPATGATPPAQQAAPTAGAPASPGAAKAADGSPAMPTTPTSPTGARVVRMIDREN